jgi:ribosomal RNA assembly protein
MDRVGVLIGQEGKTRQKLQQSTTINIFIDSKNGEILLDDRNVEDPFDIFKIENVIRAIGRGFSPDHAFKLLNDCYDLYIFDIHDYVKKKSSHVHRVKARIIGKNGKTKQLIEELTRSYISVYGHTVAVISDVVDMDITKKAIDKLLQGSKHATVYRFVEKHMKDLRLNKEF